MPESTQDNNHKMLLDSAKVNYQKLLMDESAFNEQVRTLMLNARKKAPQPGKDPLNVAHICVIGSCSKLATYEEVYAGYGICWVNNRLPAQSASFVSKIRNNLYPHLRAVKAAIKACPNDEPLVIITNKSSIINLLQAKTYLPDTNLTSLIHSIFQLLDKRKESKVIGADLAARWIDLLKQRATELALADQTLRELGDPKFSTDLQAQRSAHQSVTLPYSNFVQQLQPDLAMHAANPVSRLVFEQQVYRHPVSRKFATSSAQVVHPSTSVSPSPLPSMRSTGFAGSRHLTVHRTPNYGLRHSASRSYGNPSTRTGSRVGNRIRTIEHLSRMPPPASTTIDAIESRFMGGRKRCQRDEEEEEEEEAEAMVKRVKTITIADNKKNEPIATNQTNDINEPQSKGWKSWINRAFHWFPAD